MKLKAGVHACAAIAVAAALLTLPAGAGGEILTFGSDLGVPATGVQSRSSDTAFWNTAAAGGQTVQAPADAQIVAIRVKGGVLEHAYADNPNDPCRPLVSCIHFQVLHPDGSNMLVELSSGDFHLPITNDQERVTEYREPDLVNLCVHKGDYVDLNTIGGFEFRYDNHAGTPLQVFGRRPSSNMHWYQHDNGTNQGTSFNPSPPLGPLPVEPRGGDLPDMELLMQTVLATGPDATDICPGGYRQHVFRGLELVDSAASLKTATRSASVRGFCHGENYGSCRGTLQLVDPGGRTLDVGTFDIPSTNTVAIPLALPADLVEAVQRAGGMTFGVVANAQDNPRADSRAQASVPVQEKTTTGSLTLTPDKPLPMCVVPNLKGLKLKSTGKRLTKANCVLGKVKRQKTKKAKSVGKVVSQKPKAGTKLPNGSRVALTVGKKK
jgi:hypothetical protein